MISLWLNNETDEEYSKKVQVRSGTVSADGRVYKVTFRLAEYKLQKDISRTYVESLDLSKVPEQFRKETELECIQNLKSKKFITEGINIT